MSSPPGTTKKIARKTASSPSESLVLKTALPDGLRQALGVNAFPRTKTRERIRQVFEGNEPDSAP